MEQNKTETPKIPETTGQPSRKINSHDFFVGFAAGFICALIIGYAALMVYNSNSKPASSVISSSSVSQPQSAASSEQTPIILPQSSSAVNQPDSTVSSSTPASSAAEELPKGEYPGKYSILRDSTLINAPEDAHIQLLFNFFDDWYQSLGKLRANDITDWFYPLSAAEQENMLLNQTMLQVLCATRAERGCDLSFKDYQYGITFTGYERLPDNRIEITLLEDSCIQFDYLDGGRSFSSGIEHTFLLTTDDKGSWRISLHEYDDDIFTQIWERYCEKRKKLALFDIENSPKVFEQVYDELVNAAIDDEKERLKQLEQYEEGNRIPANAYNWRYNYDRQAAVDYAGTWTDGEGVKRNEEWPLYDNNSQNFISQCVFAGGIPMDCTGAQQWKWCGESVNTAQKMTGRSLSWSEVDDFYNYCKYNDGTGGIVAQVDALLCKAQPGDILQLGSFGKWNRSVIITDVIYDGDEPVDFLVASNSADHIAYPVSAYPYSAMRLIKIYGYN